MRWIYSSVYFLAALLLAQAQTDDRVSGNFRDLDAEDAAAAGAAGGAGGLADPTADVRSPDDDAIRIQNLDNFGLDLQSGGNQRQGAAARPQQFVVDAPEGPGIHAGFQARGPNYAASMSGGLKSSNGGALETGLNLSGSFGDSSPNAQQRRAQSTGRNAQGTGSPIQDEGATFAVAYRPGLLNALGNMFNPFRLVQQIGDAFAGGMAGLGQGMAGLTQGISQGVAGLGQGIGQGIGQGLGQGQASASLQAQYVPPQAQRNRNSNGYGVTWRPLNQVLPFMGNNNW